jgi:hypothetical protein
LTLESLVQYLRVRSMLTCVEHRSEGRALGILANIRLDSEGLPGANTLAYLVSFSVTKTNKFYNIATSAQCDKAFNGPNLRNL